MKVNFNKVIVVVSKRTKSRIVFEPSENNGQPRVTVGITQYDFKNAKTLLDTYLSRGYSVEKSNA